MTRPFARIFYAWVLIPVMGVIIGIAYFAERDGIPAIRPAAAQDELPPLKADKSAKALWICPMHAQILQDHPGSCPICGMDLVESGGAHEHAEAGIHVDAASQQRLGVRLARATLQTLSREVLAYGTVAIDETSLLNVTPKTDGWIRRLAVNSEGQAVRAGQLLYEIYSPELEQRQREYIELLQRRDRLLESMTNLSGQNAQVAASLARERIRLRQKFAYADVGAEILDEIEKTGRPLQVIPVRAPASGFVTAIGAREGSYVTPLVNLVSLAKTSRVWIDVALYPDQLDWVREGDIANVNLPNTGEPGIEARLSFPSPVIDKATQTLRARLVVDNAGRLLRPGKFVDVVIAAGTRVALAVARSALIRPGNGDRVMLARGDGHFMPVAVETGIESGDFVEIVDGLQEGAQIALNGQFMLDAAASLNEAARRMQGGH